ncbi:hypothetical protein CAPTEDRAFT_195401 [Capitella teleta]|uniref:DNA 3'-5' helicase n=1 Tax=Capitella teleta TaxID=283909 RepID=R7VCU2_CAPTE|nr:hypothetical protein CAPTEDRAFT_195401 [Capitella teleta]|eukprot:ELU16643.1 hypothetical protein CAPTEDRAFT_195401 [Capitella teleta]
MMDQCQKLSAKRISACFLDYKCFGALTTDLELESDSSESDSLQSEIICEVNLEDVEEGPYNLVYAHPESLLCARGRRLIQRMWKHLCAIAIDEAHIILEFYNFLGGETFRIDFKRIGEYLLPLAPNIPVMLFTATAPPAATTELRKYLQMVDPQVVDVNPNQANISYSKCTCPPSSQTKDHLDLLMSDICSDMKTQGSGYPKTIFYTDTDTIAYCYWLTEKKLGTSHQYDGDSIPENRAFAQYHREDASSMKEHIVKELSKSESKIRIVYCMVALGMGLDAPHVRHVVHFKPLTSLERYFQETERAGCDQQQAKAIMYFNNTDIRNSRPGITESMIRFCKNESECLRNFMLTYFGHHVPIDRDRSYCCSIFMT